MGMYDIDTSYTSSAHPELKWTHSGDKMYKLNVIPDDLSIYTWGCSTNHKTNLFNNDTFTEPYNVRKVGSDIEKTSIALCSPNTSQFYGGYSISDADSTTQTNNCVGYDSTDMLNVNYLRYVKEYYYKNYVLLIKLYVVRNFSDMEGQTFTLDSYYNNENNINYPIIRYVYVTPYYSSNDKKRTYFPMYPCINTIATADYEVYNIKRSFKWFCTIPLSSIFGSFVGYAENISDYGLFTYNSNVYSTLYRILSGRMDKVGFVAKDGRYYYFAPDLSELTKEQIMTECAKLGFCFVTSTENAQSKKYGDLGFYVPEIKGGYTTGKYFDGTRANDLPQSNWTSPTASYDNSEYDPKKPIDPNSYTDKIDLNKPALTTTGIFNRTFGLNAVNIKSLADFLWNADETIFNEIVKGLSLMGGNPIDGLIDLRLYPFDVVNKTSGGASKSIVVGRTDTKVNGIEINDYNAILDLGSCTFFPNFGNFLDYEPFTTASLYVPYVGIVPISTADFMGQTISCKMVVDITTGSCTAVVFANDIPIIYKNGNIGVEIPMTGTNSAEYASRIMGGLTSGAADVALGASSKSVGQVVSGVGSIADSALSVNNTMYNTAGSSSPACGLWQPQNCYFIIQRAVPIVPENYGHTVGYACNYQAKISECSGYTQTYNVDVSSINAPESEKNAIAEILNSGFYA